MFLPDCPELQAEGGLSLLVRMDASVSLPVGRADREGCGRLLGGGPEQLWADLVMEGERVKERVGERGGGRNEGVTLGRLCEG